MSSSCRSTPPRYASRVGWADSNPLNLQRYPFQILDEVGKYIEQGSIVGCHRAAGSYTRGIRRDWQRCEGTWNAKVMPVA